MFREMFKDNEFDTIMRYMEKVKLEPDQYCYENALAINNDIDSEKTVNYLEKKYGFKPTILVLRYANYHIRNKYFSRGSNMHHPSTSDWQKLFKVYCKK